MKIYKKNLEFFKKINSEEKAYFLGLLYADGHVDEQGFHITLLKKDGYILEHFDKLIREKGNIYNYLNNCNNPINTLSIYSKEMSKDLQKLGCFKNKTFTLRFPTEEQVPKEFQSHFIRGYFDGDGSVWEGKRKIMLTKCKKSKTGYRNKIIHNVKFNISSNIEFLKGLQYILHEELFFNYTKIGNKKGVNKEYGQLEYSGRKQLSLFYNYLYKNSTVYFFRKKSKFENIICANI